MNEFENKIGAEKLKKPEIIGLFFIVTLVTAYIIAKWGFMSGLSLMLIPILLFFLASIFYNPKIGMITTYTLNFFVLGIYRYIGIIPWGLMVDSMLIITYLAIFFQSFNRNIPWENAKNELTLLAFLWFGFSIMQLVNPEAGNRTAWFYAMRGVSLYMFLIIPLIFIIFNKPKDLNLFFLLWGIFSILGSMKGLQQKFLGVDPFEQRWLDEGGAAQHILFGKLRIFSFYSDAGQFGAAQGQAGVVFTILGFGEKNSRKKLFYFIVSILGIYGMMISGTRGAMAVPIMGFLLYVILKKNVRAMIIAAIILAGIFVFFKYTMIGQGNDTIRRMRTAFDPNDPSLQTRLDNQRRLKVYLDTRPFGGGLGSTGSLGQRYNPGTYLASVPTDSWYVMIWMEQGIVGLSLHLLILFYILGKSSYLIIFRIRNDLVKTRAMALASGMFGIMVASYGNGVLGQMPTGIILYSGMAFMFLAPRHDKEASKAELKSTINAVKL